jgi:DNA-binding response OmpR family regulator
MSPDPGIRSLDETAYPHLTAAVVYLRPTVRTLLLQVLAEAGVLVSEHIVARRTIDEDEIAPSHVQLVVLVGDGSPACLRAVRRAALLRGLPVVAVLPGASDTDEMLRAGATSVAPESEGLAGLRLAVRRAVRTAGILHGVPVRDASELTVFGCLALRQAPPGLVGPVATVGLSQVEHQLLLDLVWAQGRAVVRKALDVHLRGADRPTSPGYLKAVITRIRQKARAAGGDPDLLVSVRGTGYALLS